MEVAAAMLALLSGAAGCLARQRVGGGVALASAVAGTAAFLCGLTAIVLAHRGALSMWTASGLALGCFTTATLLVPFGVAVLSARLSWSRTQ